MMNDSTEHIKVELASLIEEGRGLLESQVPIKGKPARSGGPPVARYQNWYTRSLPVVRQLIPERLTEFEEQYRVAKRKDVNFSTYTISDYLLGMRVTRGAFKEEVFDSFTVFVVRLNQQLRILESAQTRIDSLLADITGVLQADLFDTELDKAKELLRNKHLRAAGIVAGVVLEKHLSAVCSNHYVKLNKKSTSISDYNDALKNEQLYDTPDWRFIQRLGDIRNLSAHAGRDPSTQEIEELIAGVDKVVKTVG